MSNTTGRDFTDTPGGATQTQTDAVVPAGSIGPYRLLERIGDGGMGEVWVAEQQRPPASGVENHQGQPRHRTSCGALRGRTPAFLGGFVGTLEYMSPDQAEMGGVHVGSRADIYALGAVLYELLTGELPFDRGQFAASGFVEIRRTIREVQPPRPSTRVTQLGDGTDAAEANKPPNQALVSGFESEAGAEAVVSPG
jgi:serine/threonine protein kinase